MRHSVILIVLLVCTASSTFAQGARLLRDPAVSQQHIAFTYANDLWVVDRDGGDARRLTSFPGTETLPHFSPDGSWVAFSGQYDGNTDVYIVPVEGGEPQRLTHHPNADRVTGWTSDGNVLFASARTGGPRLKSKLYAVGPDDARPYELPVPRAHTGQMSSDGGHIAYQLVTPWDPEWRNYRGGQAQPIRVLDLETYDLQKLPWEGSLDLDPVWMEDTIYFLSDRDLAMNAYAFDTKSDELRQLTFHTEYDVKRLDVGGGVVVYEQAGYLHRLDPATGESTQLEINLRGDLPWTRPQWEDVEDRIANAALSPTGKRAVFEARGEIFTVPVEDGSWRNLSDNSGAADRNPSWSPDGKWIAWFSDDSGEYQLMIADQKGLDKPRVFDLPGPTFYYTPNWSPDSQHLLFSDTDLKLWTIDVESGATTFVDTDTYAHPERTLNPRWSPDGNWIAYAKRLDSQFHAIMVYSVESGEIHQVTDGMADAVSPAWDKSGKYLYFLASTDFGLNAGWLDMSSYERPIRRGVYLAVLSAEDPSPLLPKSDEEPVGKDEEEAADSTATLQIDFDGFANRIVDLDVPVRTYAGLEAGEEGVVFFGEFVPNESGATLHRYELEEREAESFLEGVRTYTLSHDGKKMLVQTGSGWSVVDTKGEPNLGDGKLALNFRMKINPQEEWRQMFREAWRYQRDYLYVENTHGADWEAIYAMYEPWVEHVRHRNDLNHVLDILGGEVSIGHSYTGGGDMPDIDQVPIGLLGADYDIENGRYRIARIYTGESWNPDLEAPLSGPGIDVSEGDYLVGVNGAEITANDNLYAFFEQTAGRHTVIHVNAAPSMDEARQVTVVPVSSEAALRQRAWVEDNRRKVDELSGGRLAYVYLPNTGQSGYTSFNRYYFAQQHKEGVILDERYNGGGSAADYMVDIMARELHGFFNNPVGERKPFTSPGAGIWGPKVMITNEMAGSGGDLLPYLFRKMEIGTLVGTRTWGGLVGIWDVPPLIDGGRITAPRGGFFDLEGNWAVENEGIAPDIEVYMTPKAVIAGKDPQLEKAVEVALQQLKDNPVELLSEPEPPVRVSRPEGQ